MAFLRKEITLFILHGKRRYFNRKKIFNKILKLLPKHAWQKETVRGWQAASPDG